MQKINFILSLAFEILKLKILQSDWPRAFLHLTREPDFSQTCGFNRITTLFLGCFWALSLELDFSQKVRLRRFFTLKAP